MAKDLTTLVLVGRQNANSPKEIEYNSLYHAPLDGTHTISNPSSQDQDSIISDRYKISLENKDFFNTYCDVIIEDKITNASQRIRIQYDPQNPRFNKIKIKVSDEENLVLQVGIFNVEQNDTKSIADCVKTYGEKQGIKLLVVLTEDSEVKIEEQPEH